MNKLTLATALVGLTLSSAWAENIAIVGGYTHTMSGEGAISNATILIQDGRIESVSSSGDVPDGYRVIDATDKVVTPGLMGAFTQLGLVEVGYSAGTVDASHDLVTYSPLGAALDASYAINPDSTLLPIARIEGFTTAVSAMSHTNRLFHGQGAVITLGDNVSPVIKANALMVLAVDNDGADDNGGSRAALWPKLNEALSAAQSRGGQAIVAGEQWHGPFEAEDVNALMPVVQGQMPLVVEAHRASDIRQVIALKARYSDLNLVLLEGSEAWRVADELARADIPVILNPESNLPYAFDQLGATLANASRLSDAGVTIAIGVETHNIRLATQHAGNAVAYGLPWEEGLAALTINTATIFGVDTDYGSLEAGKVADVVVWSGDPLEVMEAPERVVINGVEVKLESRQTKLRDRYLERLVFEKDNDTDVPLKNVNEDRVNKADMKGSNGVLSRGAIYCLSESSFDDQIEVISLGDRTLVGGCGFTEEKMEARLVDIDMFSGTCIVRDGSSRKLWTMCEFYNK